MRRSKRLNSMQSWFARLGVLVLAVAMGAGGMATVCRADSAQDDFLKGVSDTVASDGSSHSDNSARFMAWIAAGAAVLVGLGYVAQRRERQKASPGGLHHHGKLMKELVKAGGVRPGDVKKLKALAEERGVSSPLVLLLCPSMIAAKSKAVRAKANR